MKSINNLAISCITVAVLTVAVTGFLDGEHKDVMCKGKKLNCSGSFRKNMMACVEEFKAAKLNKMAGERKRGQTCITLCALMKDGMFNTSGVYQENKSLADIGTFLPADLAPTLATEMKKCANKTAIYGVTTSPTDYLCKSHKKFLQCTTHAWMTTCVDGYDAEIWSEDE